MEPMNPILIHENSDRMALTGAAIFAARAKAWVKTKGRFFVAISGGKTPRQTHRMLAREPFRSEVPWEGVRLFWVDERIVPADHEASNFGAARKDFIERVPLREHQYHPMPQDPESGAIRYERELLQAFGLKEGQVPVFHLIYLGMGRDGHTASLFPGEAALEEKSRLVAAVRGGDPYVERLTLTLPVLNRAEQIVFMVSGREKADVTRSVLDRTSPKLPASKIEPKPGHLTWLLDAEAAAGLSESCVRRRLQE